jgi:hypothetical protein
MSNTFQRMEKKTTLPADAARELRERILPRMIPDEHNPDGEPYVVCNLYFDEADEHVIRTSVDRPYYKEKLRLRSYGTPAAGDKVFLEIKKKQDGVGTKRRAKLPYSDAVRFLETGIHPAVLPYVDEQVLREIDYYRACHRVAPTVYVSYLRAAYHDAENPDFRVTFDTDLLSRRYDLRLDAGRYGSPLLTEGTTLLEVKFKGAVPFWFARTMSEFGLSFHTFSKVGTDFKLHAYEAACAAHPDEPRYLRLIH